MSRKPSRWVRDPSGHFFSLINWWNANKDELAIDDDGLTWWQENSREAYNSGLESLAKGLSNWNKSRKGARKGRKVGFPKFKSKCKQRPGSRVHPAVSDSSTVTQKRCVYRVSAESTVWRT